MGADQAGMGTLLIVHDGSQFKEQFTEHSVEAAHDLAGVRAAMGKRRFDAVFVDASGGKDRLGELLTTVRMADDCVAMVVGANRWSPEMRSAAEICEVVMPPSEVETIHLAIRRAMRQTSLLRENRELKAGQTAGGVAGSAAGSGASTMRAAPEAELRWIESLPPRLDLREWLGSVEKAVIQKTLAATQGAQAEAARRLGLSRSDLSYKLSKYELRRPRVEKVTQG